MRIVVIVTLVLSFILCLAEDRVFSAQNNADKRGIANGYNVIVVCLDTLRADHLSCYGYPRETTPHIDRLVNDGILFENAFSQSSFTLPSLASFFTSRYVHNHKADRIERRLGEDEITIAEILKANGYKTAAFVYNAPQLNPIYGLDQGFDTYVFGEERDRRPSFIKTLPQALEWVETHKRNKFFIFLHSNDIHEPYQSPLEDFFDPDYKGVIDGQYLSSDGLFAKKEFDALGQSDIEHIIAHYDGGIRYTDGFVGKLIDYLRGSALLDRTILIIFSDHGEILADRGKRFCHGFSVHDEEVNVPLIVVCPVLSKGIRINGLIQLIDVMPTVFNMLGIDYGYAKLEGESFLSLMEGKAIGDLNSYVYAECLSGESENEESVNLQAMVRSKEWKLISSSWRNRDRNSVISPKTVRLHNFATITLPGANGFELYNLKNDPKESKNIIGVSDKTVENELLSRLLFFTAASEK